ncbi:hypothetical protein FB451DRAFT_1538117 [Mycena latifolia]|nr:hypothetical protein FB451DRAFT_1538117 [Mycena latifolia]
MSLFSADEMPITRTRTKNSMASARRPRPRSPPSMYVAYDMPPPRAPKPLEKKPKDSETRSKAARPQSPAWASSAGSLLRGRLRRKTGDVATEEISARGAAASPDELYAPPVRFSRAVQTIDLSPARADKVATRFLGNLRAVPQELAAQSTAPGRDDASVSNIYSTEAASVASVGSSVSDGGWAGSSESGECFTDDSYLTDESALTPIEFRPAFRSSLYGCDGPCRNLTAMCHETNQARPRTVALPEPQDGVMRTEPREGWVGEWNQNDMKAVIHKLRSLK